MQQPYLTLDTAYWDPRILDAAAYLNQQQAIAGRPERVRVIFFYLFDPFLVDVNGYCGGWTPDVVAQISDRGFIPGPIVTMRPGVSGGMLTPQEIVAALAKYPALTSHPVHIKIAEDQETGSWTGAAWSQALAATEPTELYGNAATVLSDYSAGVAAIWIGNYPGIPVLPPPDVRYIPGVPDDAWPDARAWQYVGSASIAGADVDVSISNVPLEISADVSPVTKRRVTMVILQAEDGAQWLHTGGVRHIGPAESAALVAAGVPVQPMKAADIAQLPRSTSSPLLLRDGTTGAVYSPTPAWRHISGGEFNALVGKNAEVEEIDAATVAEIAPPAK